jgi:hypothetical protein
MTAPVARAMSYFADYKIRRELLSRLPRRAQVAYAIDCASSVLHKWVVEYPNDRRPQEAMEAAKQWLLEQTSENKHKASTRIDTAAAAASAASAAASAAAFATHVATATVVTAAAAYAAAAARTAVYAAAIAATATFVSAVSDASDASASAARTAVYAVNSDWSRVKRLYVMAHGPGCAFDARWLTSDVVALVKGIVKDDAFDRTPILADALQDAGLDDVEVLRQLQTEQCGLSHWVVWNVMGWGTDTV